MDEIRLSDVILDLLQNREIKKLRSILDENNPIDIAAALSDMITDDEISREQFLLVYRILNKETAADVFVEMAPEIQQDLISAFTDKELHEVLDELFLDDTVDIIEEMPATVVKRMLRSVDADTRKSINQLLNYPDDSAGSIMTIEYVDLKRDMTVADSFARIRATGVDKETIYTCYVTDPNRKLLGMVSVKDLLLAKYEDIVGDIMEENVISVSTTDDQETVAQMFSKYDFIALPVVDGENRLVGIITVDDAIDVMQEEVTEDIEKMAAIRPSEKPYMRMGVWDLFKIRIPWLLLLMVSATFTGLIIRNYESALSVYAVLTAFLPMLMDTGGNSGSQSSVTIIRGLSLGEIEFSDLPNVIWKEIRVAVLCGLSLSAVSFLKLVFLDRVGATVAAIVSMTMVCTVLVAKIVGCVLPMVSKKVGLDPAVMSSPFITTIVDALSLVIYFNVANSLLHFA